MAASTSWRRARPTLPPERRLIRRETQRSSAVPTAPPGQALPAARDVAVLRQRASSLLSEIGREGREREQQRHLPYAFARKVANAGLLTFRIPKDYGGPGSSDRDAIRFVMELAAVDSNLAQALRPSFGLVEGLRAAG